MAKDPAYHTSLEYLPEHRKVHHDRAHDVAELSFKKKQRRLLDRDKAMAEYNAARSAEDEKTARLRALRLSRDAAENMAPAKKTKVSKSYPPRKRID